jgi:DNA-directed RNA polymerase specialized sigma24 family protein
MADQKPVINLQSEIHSCAGKEVGDVEENLKCQSYANGNLKGIEVWYRLALQVATRTVHCVLGKEYSSYAEDAIIESIVKAFDTVEGSHWRPKVSNIAQFRCFVRTAARRTSLSLIKKIKAQVARDMKGGMDVEPSCFVTDYDNREEMEVRRQQFQAAYRSLSRTDQRFVDFCLTGLSYRQAVRQLGLSGDCAGRFSNRVLCKLRSIIRADTNRV